MNKLLWGRHQDRHHWWETIQEIVEHLSAEKEKGSTVDRQRDIKRNNAKSPAFSAKPKGIPIPGKRKRKRVFLDMNEHF